MTSASTWVAGYQDREHVRSPQPLPGLSPRGLAFPSRALSLCPASPARRVGEARPRSGPRCLFSFAAEPCWSVMRLPHRLLPCPLWTVVQLASRLWLKPFSDCTVASVELGGTLGPHSRAWDSQNAMSPQPSRGLCQECLVPEDSWRVSHVRTRHDAQTLVSPLTTFLTDRWAVFLFAICRSPGFLLRE